MSPASSAVAYHEAELGRRLETKSNLDEVLDQILGRPPRGRGQGDARRQRRPAALPPEVRGS